MTLYSLLQTEETEYELKESLETEKPRSWLKTVVAFASGLGGSIFFGVRDADKKIMGISDPATTIDKISNLIKTKIEPMLIPIISSHNMDGETIIEIKVKTSIHQPHYYVSDGNRTAYIRLGSESVQAPAHILGEMLMRGKNLTFDAMPTAYKVGDLTFTMLDATFKRRKKMILTEKDYLSFGMCLPDGTATYAGLMFSDECPLLQSRVFCTHWDGLDKSGGVDDAVDDKEFEGDLISQLMSAHDFIKMNSKVRWKKMSNHRVNKPDYADRAVFEALANAFMHRDYSIVGSEVHVDMFGDRLEIYSPGGMPDGTLIQSRDIENVPSTRRNPVISEIFHRLDFIERRGSGFQKIQNETTQLHGYTDAYAPIFKSTPTAFHVILKNMNYLTGSIEVDDLVNVPLNVPANVPVNRQNKILLLLAGNPSMTADELAQQFAVAKKQFSEI